VVGDIKQHKSQFKYSLPLHSQQSSSDIDWIRLFLAFVLYFFPDTLNQQTYCPHHGERSDRTLAEIMYRVVPKIVSCCTLSISLLNINQFLQFFYQ